MKGVPALPAALSSRIQKLEAEWTKVDFVLVWGSGSSSPKQYAKRLAVRDSLRASVGDDRVFMSEDEEFQGLVERCGMAAAEALQAASFDAVIILDTSIGPHTELLRYRDLIRDKTLVFAAREHKESSGFASTAYDVFKGEGYPAEEFESCDKIRRLARDFVAGLQLIKTFPEALHRLRAADFARLGVAGFPRIGLEQ